MPDEQVPATVAHVEEIANNVTDKQTDKLLTSINWRQLGLNAIAFLIFVAPFFGYTVTKTPPQPIVVQPELTIETVQKWLNDQKAKDKK